ncbi:ABC transporter permease [Kribbella sp. CA-247076]|uniref:ABC transporter permease n=1 Tax=Kribbella sp. CA-247076 TaxID=3239941 RepID=UPI003D8E51A6
MPTAADPTDPAALAERYGLTKSSLRPPLGDYLRELWSRRKFVVSYAAARTYAMYAGARLGSLWQVLTPLLNAAVYYLAFGVLLGTKDGIDNYVGFLLSGIFVFTYTQRCMTEGSRSLALNLSLIRTLHFPRATLPLAYVLNELNQMLVSLCLLFVIVGVTDGLSWSWLLVAPALLLQSMFNVGMTLIFARIGTFVADVTQLLPFVTRTWLYVSGIFFSLPAKLTQADAPDWVIQVLAFNPISAYIDIVRRALLDEHDAHQLPYAWAIAAGWSVVALAGGFVYFWQAEDRYGRG